MRCCGFECSLHLLLDACCLRVAFDARHGLPIAAVNMIKTGERYGYALFLLFHRLMRLNVKQLHMDIICKWKDWARSTVAGLDLALTSDQRVLDARQQIAGHKPQFSDLRCVLSEAHGMLHGPYCQVIVFSEAASSPGAVAPSCKQGTQGMPALLHIVHLLQAATLTLSVAVAKLAYTAYSLVTSSPGAEVCGDCYACVLLPCGLQILNMPSWNTGCAKTIGEEGEQGFSYLSRYAGAVRNMSIAGRFATTAVECPWASQLGGDGPSPASLLVAL